MLTEELREAAWAEYEALPWPVRTDEEWRRTDPKLLPRSADSAKPQGGAFRVGWESPSAELIRSGVILTDLATAAKQFPELIEGHLFRTGKPSGLSKFVALHEAVARQGIFCHVPDGVRAELPLRSWIEAGAGGSAATRLSAEAGAGGSAATRLSAEAGGGPAVFPHLLVVVGQNAELTLIDERRSASETAAPVLSNEMAEILVRTGGVLRYVHLQRWNHSASELFTQRAILERDAQFLNITVGLGGRLAKASVETVLKGAGARADLLGIFFGSETQHFDFHTLQDHQAPNSTSDLLYKSALSGQAEAVYTGLIRIEKQAQKSNAYQANRCLLLSQGAKADSIPMLEIEADDVRCTHGVAVGPVDEEQAFYLMSRGLPAAEAERLIVKGFFEQILKRIPSENLREELAAEIAARIERSARSKT